MGQVKYKNPFLTDSINSYLLVKFRLLNRGIAKENKTY
jgi:hypothetical protein